MPKPEDMSLVEMISAVQCGRMAITSFTQEACLAEHRGTIKVQRFGGFGDMYATLIPEGRQPTQREIDIAEAELEIERFLASDGFMERLAGKE